MGDAILMSGMVESIAQFDASIEVHVLVRKGHGVLFENNPNVAKVWEFDKSNGKLKNMLKLAKNFRKVSFDAIFNCHRFASSGVIALGAGAKRVIGFDKNPLSFLFSKQVRHEFANEVHEVDRNHKLLQLVWPEIHLIKPKLYPSLEAYSKVSEVVDARDFIVIAPSSIWFTKQYPVKRWRNLIEKLGDKRVFLIGAKSDKTTCKAIASGFENTKVLAGNLSLMESVALIAKAEKVFACDSAPTHMASAMNVETHSVFCSTTAEFGFGPISDKNKVHETKLDLECRPCGIHGKKACPKGHFKCSEFEVVI